MRGKLDPKTYLAFHQSEELAHIKMTLESLIASTDADLLEEILFVDDNNHEAMQFHSEILAFRADPAKTPGENRGKTSVPIRIHRNTRRLGIVKSKLVGSVLANGELLQGEHCGWFWCLFPRENV